MTVDEKRSSSHLTVNLGRRKAIPCFIKISEKLNVKLPSNKDFLDWLEKQLIREFKVNGHKELEKVLEDRYRSDSWSLKLLLEEFIIAYKLKIKKKKLEEQLVKETGVV